jgi:SAM-dependent methyltransferase
MKIIENYSEIPFAEPGDDNADNANKGRRVRIVREFIGQDLSELHTLDIGCTNAFGRKMGIKDNTLATDLNVELVAPSDNYDLILCSELIEHNFNPGRMIERCWELLKPGGVLIVSTPVGNMSYFLQSPHHLTEYRPKRFRVMLEYYGFEVKKLKIFCIWDWWPFAFSGIRPLWRCLFHRSMLFYCVKGERVHGLS